MWLRCHRKLEPPEIPSDTGVKGYSRFSPKTVQYFERLSLINEGGTACGGVNGKVLDAFLINLTSVSRHLAGQFVKMYR